MTHDDESILAKMSKCDSSSIEVNHWFQLDTQTEVLVLSLFIVTGQHIQLSLFTDHYTLIMYNKLHYLYKLINQQKKYTYLICLSYNSAIMALSPPRYS
jgi:hypothetical protein